MRYYFTTLIPIVWLLLNCEGKAPQTEVGGGEKMKTGYTQLDSARLYYEQAGAGKDLVLIHGAYLDHRSWDPQFEVFARQYRVTRYDVRGHGKTETIETPFSDYEDLKILLDSLGIKKAALVGLSMGGGIALDFAASFPERVEALILVGPGIGGGEYDSPVYSEYMERLMPALQTEDFSQIIDVMLSYWSIGPEREAKDVDSLFLSRMRQLMDENRQRWYLNAYVSRLDPPVLTRAADLLIPILIVNGKEDMPDVLKNAEKFASLAPNVSLEVIENAGHIINLEKPEAFNELVLAFLAQLQ